MPEWVQEELSVGSQDCRCEGYSKGKLGSMGSAQEKERKEVADGSMVTSPVHSVNPGLPSHQYRCREVCG